MTLSKAKCIAETMTGIEASYNYIKDDNFYEAPIIKSNLVALSLFTRVSEHGICYSVSANFR